MRYESRSIGTALVVATLTGACAQAEGGPPGAVGTRAPEYSAVTLAGDTVSLAQLRGQAVVLNIWATWCPPCREEMPSLQQLQEHYADEGLQVVAVSIDRRSAAGEVKDFVDEYELSFTILHDADERVTRTFRTVGVPETILVDRNGRVVQRWIGKIDAMDESVRAAVRTALDTPGRS